MTSLLLILLIFPLLWLLRLFAIARALACWPFRRATVEPIAPEALPDTFREAAAPWTRALASYGFRLLGGWNVRRHGDPALDDEAIVLLDETGQIRAFVRPRPESQHAGECYLVLQTTTGDGREIITASFEPEPIAPVPEAFALAVEPTNSVADLLAMHRTRIQSVGPVWRCVDLARAAERQQHECDAVYHTMAQSSLVHRYPDGLLHYRLHGAVVRAAAVLRHGARQKKALKRHPHVPIAPVPDRLRDAFEWRNYQQLAAVKAMRMPAGAKAVISIVSAVLFAVALGYRYSPVVAVSMLVSLLIHEGGHLLGMRIFGHRDTELLFIPFFGGAAVARDEQVLPPWKRVVIVLLGPLPGIFLGAGLSFFATTRGGPAWLNEAAITCLVLNAFNLLPIMPLDGGRIFDAAIGARWPRLRVLFMGASAAALVLIGWLSTAASLLLGLGVAMLVSLPTEWRLIEVRLRAQVEHPDEADEETLVRALLRQLREPQWQKTKVVRRLALARRLQLELRTPEPGFLTVAFAFLGYTTPVWLLLPVLGYFAVLNAERGAADAERRAEAAGLTLRAPAMANVDVPPAENAAVPYAQAQLVAQDLASGGEAGGNEALVALLHDAAGRSVFAPAADATTDEDRLTTKGRRALPLTLAFRYASQQVAGGQPQRGLRIAIDGLRVAALMESAHGWLPWTQHVGFEHDGWDAVESALSAGAVASNADLATLRSLAAERTELAYASEAVPEQALERARLMAAVGQDHGGSKRHPILAALLRPLMRVNPTLARLRVSNLNAAVKLHDSLQQIRAGHWPALPQAGGMDEASLAVAQLSDILARHRQAVVAFAWLQHAGARPSAADALASLGIDAARLVHPITGEKLRIERNGSEYAIRCGSALAQIWGLKGKSLDLQWRLPAPGAH